MFKIIIRRLLAAIPVLFLVSFIVFGLIALVPGDPAFTLAGEDPTPERIELVSERLGLNDPFFVRYFRWLGGALQGDFGTSLYSSLTVTDAIAPRLPVTLSLTLVTLAFSTMIGITSGLVSGLRPGRLVDRVTSSMTTFGIAVPHFWLALVLVVIFSLHFELVPAVGYTPISEGLWPWLSRLIIPAVALGSASWAEISRQTRAGVATVMHEDYVRTAHSKGIAPAKVVFKHVMKNAAIPVVTVIGMQAGRLFGGSVIIEQIFGLPGIGTFAYRSVTNGDFPMIQGIVLIAATVVLMLNLLVDISYTYFNPRVRAQR